jgi:hypothetical protein
MTAGALSELQPGCWLRSIDDPKERERVRRPDPADRIQLRERVGIQKPAPESSPRNDFRCARDDGFGVIKAGSVVKPERGL